MRDTGFLKNIFSTNKSIVEKVTNNNRCLGGLQNFSSKINLPKIFNNNGFSSICEGRHGELYILYADMQKHAASRGLARIIKSVDNGINWSQPVTVFDKGDGNGVQEVTIMFDAVSDSYIATVVDIDLSDDSQKTRFFKITGDPLSTGDWVQKNTPEPFTQINKSHQPVVRRGRNLLWITMYGRDFGETGDNNRPVMIRSTNDGESWEVFKTFGDVTGNEPCVYWKHSKGEQNKEIFISLRNTNISNGMKVIRSIGESLPDPEVYNTRIPVAGGHAVINESGYFIMLARNSGSGGGSVGSICYSLNGIDWSELEETDYHYPFQPQFCKTSIGEYLLVGVMEPNSPSSEIGFMWFSKLRIPDYSEVVRKFNESEIIILNRFTDIEPSSNYETRWIRNYGRDAKILIRAEGGSGDTISSISVRFTFWGANGVTFPFDTTINTNMAGPQMGTIEVPNFGRYFKVRFTNGESTLRRLYAVMQSF